MRARTKSNPPTQIGSQGIYTLSEAALLIGEKGPSRIRAWFVGEEGPDGKRREPVFTPQYESNEGGYRAIALGFLNLVEAKAAAEFRKRRISSQHLRKAHEELRRRTGEVHPFASQRIYASQREMLWAAVSESGDRQLQAIVTKQFIMQEFWPENHTSITYDAITELASRWDFIEFSTTPSTVAIQPKLNFGRPTLMSSGIPTEVLSDAFKANEGDTRRVASWFGVDEREVKQAVAFEEWLHGRASKAAA